jgi:hypothetical protein
MNRKHLLSWSVASDNLPTGDPLLLIVILGTLLLSWINGVVSIEIGATLSGEANPIMGSWQRIGDGPFIFVKLLLTFVPLLFFFLFQNRRFFGGRISGKALLMVVPIPYLAVVAYGLLLVDNPARLLGLGLSLAG